MTTTEQQLFLENTIRLDLEPSREEQVEEAIRTFINLSGVLENLEIIAENIVDTDFLPQLQSRLQVYCIETLERGDRFHFRGADQYDTRALIISWLDKLDRFYPNKTGREVHQSLRQWGLEVEHVRRLSRDLANRIFYRKKQKNRERVEAATMSHPLVKSWEGLSKKNAVERISRSLMNKFLNRQANLLEVLLQRTNIQTYPSRITIEPTSACNYRCTMCTQGHYTERPSYFELDDDMVERALPVLEFVENLATQVTGEPTLSLQLGKIANYASCHGVQIDMITNGSLLHKTNADLSKFSTICISFDGAIKEVFEAQRVGSSFENVLNNIRLTRERNPLVQLDLNVCVTRLNITQLADIVRIAADLGIDRVLFNPLNTQDYPASCDLPHLDALAVGANNFEELNAAVNSAREAAVGTSVRVVNFLTDRMLTSNAAENPEPVDEILLRLAQLETKNSSLTPEDAAGRLIETRFPFLPDILDLSTISGCIATPFNPSVLVSRDTIRDEYDELLKQADIGFGNKVRLPYCTAPFTGGIIFANGGYIPCCYVDKDVSFGSIARTSFERIWNSPGLQKLRRSMFDDSLLIPTCHNCNARQRYIFTTQLLQVIHRLGYRWEDIEFSTNFNPPVVVKAQIDALRDEFFAPGTCYSLGTPIKFGTEGNARPFMSAGFSVPGPSSVWNDGFESFLSFNVTSEASSSLVFEVSLLPFLHSDLLPQQRVEVFVNGRYIDSWCLKRPVISRCHVTVEEPLVGADGRVQFAFRFPDASSWYHLGVNKSKGSRSVMFIEARLYDASAQEEIK